MNNEPWVKEFRKNFGNSPIWHEGYIKQDEIEAFISKVREEAKKEEREKTEGEIYNELVKIADKSYGVLRMLDVAKYILVERTKESNSLTGGHEGKEEV